VADRKHLERLTKELTDKGKLIEAGWVGMRIACDLHDAPPDQLHQMRMAFFAGAQHLFGSINTIMDDDREPTESDLRRMELIHNELQVFITEFARDNIPSEGGIQ